MKMKGPLRERAKTGAIVGRFRSPGWASMIAERCGPTPEPQTAVTLIQRVGTRRSSYAGSVASFDTVVCRSGSQIHDQH
jgi:hypothetical protein